MAAEIPFTITGFEEDAKGVRRLMGNWTDGRQGCTKALCDLEPGEELTGAIAHGSVYDAAAHESQRAEARKAKAPKKAQAAPAEAQEEGERARQGDGTFQADDPSTPENEAFAPKKKAKGRGRK
jgi:hypothetical protein